MYSISQSSKSPPLNLVADYIVSFSTISEVKPGVEGLSINIIKLYERQTPTVMMIVETSRASPETGIPSTWVVNAFLGPRVAA